MKVLVLSCGTGGGHDAAGHAVQEELAAFGHTCDFLEIYDLKSQRTSTLVANAYVLSIRRPSVFSGIYKVGSAASWSLRRLGVKSPVYFTNRGLRHRLSAYVLAGGYDAIVTSHLFAGECLTAIRKEGGLRIPIVAVETDYVCIPFWEETELDCYVIPHEECMNDFIQHGLPEDRLLPLGIPVSRKYSSELDGSITDSLRESVRRELGFNGPVERPFFCIMSGSMGFGNVGNLVECILAQGDAHVLVCCGHNDRLRNNICARFGSRGVRAMGYTTNDARYLRACDVLLTKPGGLTSTEAAVAGVNLVLTNPIPGCETANRDFFVSHGMALSGEDAQEQARLAYSLARDRRAGERMKLMQRQTLNRHAARDIRLLLESLVDEPPEREADIRQAG